MRKGQRIALFVLTPAVLLLTVALFAFGETRSRADAPAEARAADSLALADSSLEKATFAGGCFWCVESALQDLPGVKAAVSGFSGGTQPNPTYDEVSSGATDYAESVQVAYDPEQISYKELLDAYWRGIDPTDAGGQFADRGSQYRPVIFYHNERQKRLAEQSKAKLAESGPFEEPIVVPIEPFERFYAAEDYHQDYYKTHAERYKRYFEGSGRGPFLRRIWGEEPTAQKKSSSDEARMQQASATPSDDSYADFEKPSDAKLRQMLTDMQYEVTQENGTEPAFQNKYWDNKQAGIYVDVVSGEPLFSSKTKFDSGTGWPSFYKPLEPSNVVEKEDRSLGMVRTEVRSKHADSHLGHVFEWTGEPEVPTGLRYCLNSAALRFIPADQLKAEGYGEYASRFDGVKTASSE